MAYYNIISAIGLFLVIYFFFATISVFLCGEWIATKISDKLGKPVSPIALAVGLIFTLFSMLILSGITGSSLLLEYNGKPFIETNIAPIASSPRMIRYDEWMKSTPFAIGQMNHKPPFPIVNRNLGEDGQNMLIVGGTGVPIRHLTLLAKPATWGFFLFDLKSALAWYWWFPIFGGLLSLWWLFSFLIPGHWRLAFLLSLLFCLSPYTVAWSNTPAYAIFFPNVALSSTMLLLRQSCWFRLLILGLALGLSSAGFVLLLYPAWQISLIYLYLPLSVGLILRDRQYLRLDSGKMVALGLAVVIASIILLSWWIDAKSAINSIANTIYPGKRILSSGGEMSLSDLLRGFTNIGSLYHLDSSTTNESEIASFYYLFFPLMIAILFHLRESKRILYIIFPLSVFTLFCLIYMLNGVPLLVSKLTMWSRVPSERADIALGLSYIMLCGLVLANGKEIVFSYYKNKIFIYLSSLAWTIVVAFTISQHPAGVIYGISDIMRYTLLLGVFLSGVWLMLSEAKKFMAISLFICCATTIAFHPLSFAPDKIDLIKEVNNKVIKNYKKVLALQDLSTATALLSVGVPTINGVLFYPQMSLWRRLGVEKTSENIFNRFHDLNFVIGKVRPHSTFRLELDFKDHVVVFVDPERFNFGLSGADVVVAPKSVCSKLEYNRSLRFVFSNENFSWFDVVPVTNSNVKVHE